MQKKIDTEQLVDHHGDYLFRYAFIRVREEGLSEDLVQETFLAAVRSAESFKGESSERTWLTAILRNKIIDHFRKSSRESTFDNSDLEEIDSAKFFQREDGWSGFWSKKYRPSEWNASPETVLENKAFYEILEKCLDELPDKIGKVFRSKELEELESDEIRKIFDISSSNYWVMLYRARLALRRCMEIYWFRPNSE